MTYPTIDHLLQPFCQWQDGQWRSLSDGPNFSFTVYNPATGEPLATLADEGAEEADAPPAGDEVRPRERTVLEEGDRGTRVGGPAAPHALGVAVDLGRLTALRDEFDASVSAAQPMTCMLGSTFVLVSAA